MKKIAFMMAIVLMLPKLVSAEQPNLEINAKSALLMEQSTGNILYEQNADEPLPIASVTKIMTMLLICEAIDDGKISLNDMVPVSERAMSMGGSTMFLETGDLISVDEMLKGIAVASANDGAVAMAEYVAGSEEEFVRQMNVRAKELGMTNTQFINTNGLDAEGHYASARDVALMSRELLNYELIFNYTKIWTDTMRGGKFELANTNKLIRFYEGANGLKTGSTSRALCCLSATAERNGMQLIAVVLGASDSNSRFDGARTLLDYGFSAYTVRDIIPLNEELGKLSVSGGVEKEVGCLVRHRFTELVPKSDTSVFEYTIRPLGKLKAPVYTGDCIGEAVVTKDGKEYKTVPVYASGEVDKKTFFISLAEILKLIYQ